MKKLFISHAEEDEAKVDKLTESLQKHGAVWHFKRSLRKGTNHHKEIDEALGDSDYVLCVITKDYFKSDPAKDEAYAMFNEETKLRMLYFEDVPNVITKKHPQLSAKWGIQFKDYEHGVSELIRSIGGTSDHVEKYAKSQNRSTDNPFCKARAEFEDPNFIAKFFYEPEKEKYDRLIGPQAVIMEGGRGSGKTMILRSLEAIPAIERTGKDTFVESHLNYFGIFIRINRGGLALSNKEELDVIGNQLSKHLFVDDMNLQFTETLIDNLSECSNAGKLPITKKFEEKICREIISILNPRSRIESINFRALKKWINDEKSNIRLFIVRKAMGLDPQYNGCASGIDTFKKVCTHVKSVLDELKNVTIFLLIDEYENLLPYQQTIINTLIKLADNTITIKIASKFEGIYNMQTLMGQELQRNHDYHRILLDYDLTKPGKIGLYKKLVIGVCHKYLENAGFEHTNIVKLLKEGADLKITEESLRNELNKMLSNRVRKKDYSGKEIEDRLNYYRTTLIHRCVISKRVKKDYSGFNNFLYLSSGIIRFFLDLCGMVFLLAVQDKLNISKIAEMPTTIQTKAAHTVSHALLEKLALGAEDHGIAMQKFVMDIGDIFRTKLIYDNSEPETIRISIEDPEKIWPKRLKSLISTGVRESVFQQIETSQALKPKNPAEHRPTTYLLNRIFAPGLGITYNARWGMLFKASELDAILSNNDTTKTKIHIIAKIKKEATNNLDDEPNGKLSNKILDEWS